MVIINADNIAKINKEREVDERLEQNQNTTIPRSIVKIKDTHIHTQNQRVQQKKERQKKDLQKERTGGRNEGRNKTFFKRWSRLKKKKERRKRVKDRDRRKEVKE